ncbi:hypothetical protein MPSYJ_46660 [Mycolicibacterium psychrotolerans]|uniref:DUF222 domain-containing protein n=1 Tax=Mycolicibacterium psychrotolerans TaxID=216929 RepID=A0A7I7MGA8_9MYCO|nr:hypothetical protein MPSYJ_46660 [Mycolicibacterium psychrotolerans]
MSGTDLQAAVAAVVDAVDALAGCDSDLATGTELVEVLDELETVWCRLPALRHRLLARLQTETTPQQMGAKNWKDVLAIRWRITTAEAHRRLSDAALLAPRQPVTGPPLPPVLHATSVAQAQGLINAEHVEVIRKAVDKLPGFVDTTTREQFEVDLVRTAVGAGPTDVENAADLTLFLLDQDGPEPDDTERARTRGVTKGKQRRDAMTDLAARLTPEAWAVFEVLFAKYAAPGMCNPDDPEPCISGTPTQAQIDNDHRSLAQRQHDALLAIGRIALMSGEVGHLNGLPVAVIIRTPCKTSNPAPGSASPAAAPACPSKTSSGWPDTPTIIWRCSTKRPGRRWICSAAAGSPPRRSGSCSSPATGAAPNRAAPSAPTAPRSIM